MSGPSNQLASNTVPSFAKIATLIVAAIVVSLFSFAAFPTPSSGQGTLTLTVNGSTETVIVPVEGRASFVVTGMDAGGSGALRFFIGLGCAGSVAATIPTLADDQGIVRTFTVRVEPGSLSFMAVSNGVTSNCVGVTWVNPTPTPTNTPEPTATSTPEPTATNTPEPTATNTPEPTATNTPEPTATSTPEPTATSSPSPTATSTPENTATQTPSPTATSASSPTPDHTPTATATPTPAATSATTPSPTTTPIAEPSASATISGGAGPMNTPTPESTQMVPVVDLPHTGAGSGAISTSAALTISIVTLAGMALMAIGARRRRRIS